MIDTSKCQDAVLKDLLQRASWNEASSLAAREAMNRTPSLTHDDGVDSDRDCAICGDASSSDDDDPLGNPGIYMQNYVDCIIRGDDEGYKGDLDNVNLATPVITTNDSLGLNGIGSAEEEANAKEGSSDTIAGDMLQIYSLQIQDEPFSIENISTTSDAFFNSYVSAQKANNDKRSLVEAPSATSHSLKATHGSNTNGSDVADCKIDDIVRSNLFVSGLHSCVTDVELYTLFSSFGKIESAKVMLDIHTGKSRSIAFVKYEDVASAKSAVDALNGTTFLGELIAVRVAKPHAAYRPGAPTNRTFVRNVPLSLKKTDLVAYFGAYGEVVDVSIHSDTALRSSDKRRNIAFITYTTKEAAAWAARETHTKTAFPDCDGIPLLAKVAEDSLHRIERLARRGAPRSGAAATLAPPGHSLAPPGGEAAAPGAQAFAFPPAGPLPPAAFYPAPFYPVAPGQARAAPLFFAPPLLAPVRAVPAAPEKPQGGGKPRTEQAAAGLYAGEAVGAYHAMISPPPTVMYCLPNGQLAFAAAATVPQQHTPHTATSQRTGQKGFAIVQAGKGRGNEGKRKGV